MTALCQCVTFVAPLRDMCYYCVTRSYRPHYIRDIVTLPVVTTSNWPLLTLLADLCCIFTASYFPRVDVCFNYFQWQLPLCLVSSPLFINNRQLDDNVLYVTSLAN